MELCTNTTFPNLIFQFYIVKLWTTPYADANMQPAQTKLRFRSSRLPICALQHRLPLFHRAKTTIRTRQKIICCDSILVSPHESFCESMMATDGNGWQLEPIAVFKMKMRIRNPSTNAFGFRVELCCFRVRRMHSDLVSEKSGNEIELLIDNKISTRCCSLQKILA